VCIYRFKLITNYADLVDGLWAARDNNYVGKELSFLCAPDPYHDSRSCLPKIFPLLKVSLFPHPLPLSHLRLWSLPDGTFSVFSFDVIPGSSCKTLRQTRQTLRRLKRQVWRNVWSPDCNFPTCQEISIGTVSLD